MTGEAEDMTTLMLQKDSTLTSLKVALLKSNTEGTGRVEVLCAEKEVLKEKIMTLEAKAEDLT